MDVIRREYRCGYGQVRYSDAHNARTTVEWAYLPPHPDMLAPRNSSWVAKKKTMTRRSTPDPPIYGNAKEADTGSSDRSSSSEMPELATVDEGELEEKNMKSRETLSRRSPGRTVQDATENDPKKIEQMVHNLISRQPSRRNSNGSDLPTSADAGVPPEMSVPGIPHVRNVPKSQPSHPPGKSTTSVFASSRPDVPPVPTTQSSHPVETVSSASPSDCSAPVMRHTFHLYAPPGTTTVSTPPVMIAAPMSKRDEQVQAVYELSRLALGFPSTPTTTADTAVLPPSLTDTRDLINSAPEKNIDTVELNELLPSYMRRRSVPSRHRVVT